MIAFLCIGYLSSGCGLPKERRSKTPTKLIIEIQWDTYLAPGLQSHPAKRVCELGDRTKIETHRSQQTLQCPESAKQCKTTRISACKNSWHVQESFRTGSSWMVAKPATYESWQWQRTSTNIAHQREGHYASSKKSVSQGSQLQWSLASLPW